MINTNLSKDVNLSTLLLTFIFITLFLDRDISPEQAEKLWNSLVSEKRLSRLFASVNDE